MLTLRSVTNDAAVLLYHTEMLSDMPLTVHFGGHITMQRCYVTVEKVTGYQDETEREEESKNNSNTKQLLVKQEQLRVDVKAADRLVTLLID